MTIEKILFYFLFYFVVMPFVTALFILIISKMYDYIKFYLDALRDMLIEQEHNPKLRNFILYLNLLLWGFLLSLIVGLFYELPF